MGLEKEVSFVHARAFRSPAPASHGAGRLVSFACLACLVGCSGALPAAEAEFEEGHYPAAKQALASLEGPSGSWGEPARAEYALFRGLTHQALGDRARALEWLHRARAIDEAHPGILTALDQSRLHVALDSLDAP